MGRPEPLFVRAGTEAQRGEGTCSGSHSTAVGDIGLKSESLILWSLCVHSAQPFLFPLPPRLHPFSPPSRLSFSPFHFLPPSLSLSSFLVVSSMPVGTGPRLPWDTILTF